MTGRGHTTVGLPNLTGPRLSFSYATAGKVAQPGNPTAGLIGRIGDPKWADLPLMTEASPSLTQACKVARAQLPLEYRGGPYFTLDNCFTGGFCHSPS